jgi:serine/threonine protein kinase
MVLNDDSNPSDKLPQLPELPGMDDFPGAAPKGSDDSGGAQLSGEKASDVVPDFSASERYTKDMSVAVDLPAGRVASAQADEPVVEEHDPYLGRVFGNYELVKKVGQGGMGLVYKGRQVSLDRVVAVKILNKSLCDNAEFIKRFEREAKSIARINHPNIMAVYDFGQTDGLYYMVTEFIEGASLSKQISDRVMLSIEDFAPLLVQSLAGLAHVSTSGIVHRDIKPDNILVTLDGVAKIADFGLAKDVSRNDTTDLTAVGLAMGTPAYMSPEQCMGRKLDGRSDIYALGVTAYLALTGEKPFTGQSSFEIMTKQREFTPPAPRQLNPAIPKEVSDMIMKMLAKTPQDRFKDAEDCRQHWLELGNRLGFMRTQGGDMRGGDMRGGDMRGNEAMRGSEAMRMTNNDAAKPRSSLSAPLPSVPSVAASTFSAPSAPPSLPSDAQAPRTLGTDPQRRARVSGEFTAPAPSNENPEPARPVSERQGRSITERRLPTQRPTTTSDSMTCAKCGMLNRGDAVTCLRCGNPLRDIGSDPLAAKSQEAEALRLYQQGQFREAGTLYARLADKETDRRLRAILRSKERDARTKENQSQVQELKSRTKGMIERGDIRGSIELLERGLANVREAGASSTGAETKLLDDINNLRARLKHRRNMRIIIIVFIICLVVVALLVAVSPQGAKMFGLASEPANPATANPATANPATANPATANPATEAKP